MPRLFTGLEVPADIAEALARYRGGLYGARWIDVENYHITLRFIGDVDATTAADIYDSLADIDRPPVTVTLDMLDSFGGSRPRTIFARVRPNPALTELQADHERCVRRAGLPPEPRKFTPHVTLARLRDASPLDVADYFAGQGAFRPLTFTADRFVLFSSRASVGGGPYIVEAAYALARHPYMSGRRAAAGA
ncbi:RNA 2',3'-cyclic phosphodiesterase [Chelatococcus daeguensis]|uniref:RNA 2',3'-cyclic phosphodiesterase n=1 Tax=Chelatococcus daeguensis TaxID=444444 RepID=A0AAC9JMB3_9HYPH|nr:MULTISPECIES: RNA 2',3'-cyclic phosphodiesterase [Chelatococcus]APF36282.1 2'-5' RNA ligase [Chelatococcus daeguensis]KZE30606.1 2'-5' RNA ligase [Chelatococcus daeguensis]MBM3081963.1 RNA 2',3'-cyclic phosphodiesterase [Chelatococcus daeguensis]